MAKLDMQSVIVLAAAVALMACGASSKQLVTRPVADKIHASTLAIQEEPSEVGVPQEAHEQFQKMLRDRLHGEGRFGQGSEVTLKWRFAKYDEGSRTTRFLVGFGAGKGKLFVQAKYYDLAGKEVAATETQCTISGGAFGGSFSGASVKCADEIAAYTKKYFGR